MPRGNPGVRRERSRCGICGAVGVNARTCTGDRATHQDLQQPRKLAPLNQSGLPTNIWGSLRPMTAQIVSGIEQCHTHGWDADECPDCDDDEEPEWVMNDDLPEPIDVEQIVSILEVHQITNETPLERIAAALERIAEALGN